MSSIEGHGSGNLYHPGYIEIISVEIKAFSGKSVNLQPYFFEMNIQEDIFMPATYGNITIIDSDNLFERLPIVGEETLTITYRDYAHDKVTKIFYVYGVPGKTVSGEKSIMYTLEFCSIELIRNRVIKVSKSYKNMEPHKIASDAFSLLGSDKPLTITDTILPQDFIATYVNPIEVIQAMAARAISPKKETGSFIFFENKNGFNFVPIESLIQAKAVPYYIDNAHKQPINKVMFTANLYKYFAPVNNIKSITSGSQGAETKSLDLLKRTVKDYSYDHFSDDQYKEIQRVNGTNPDLKTTTSRYEFKSNKGVTKFTILPQEDSGKNTKHEVLAKRYNIISSYMNGPKIHAELPFNTDLTVGTMVDIQVPAANVKEAMTTNDFISPEKYIQGKYLVSAVRTLIHQGNAVNIVEFAKDSYTKSHDEQEGIKTTDGKTST